MKKFFVMLLVFYSLFSANVKADSSIDRTIKNISTQSYVLIDPISGRTLIEKNSEQTRAMASTTKIMTAIIALERGNLNSRVKVSPKASSIGGSSFHLKTGETLSLENMLYGLLLPSGNDAAVAIAEHVGGTVENFTKLMNLKAKEIGALNTHFMNPHGLDELGHYTTARDLAIIARYACHISKFREIVKTREKIINDGSYTRHIYNTNKLLGKNPYITGIKTGYTGHAGKCLVASAVRNGFQLISVILGSKDHFYDSNALLNYGFSHFRPKHVVIKGKVYSTVGVKNGISDRVTLAAGEDIILPIGENENVELEIVIPDSIVAPIVKNQSIGEIHVYINGNYIFKTNLISTQDVREKTLFDIFYKLIREWLNVTNQIVEFS